MYEKNGKNYDFFFCQKFETLVDELKKYSKQNPPFYGDEIHTLPANVGELTKEEILAFYNKQPGKENWSRVIISASPATVTLPHKNGKSFTLFLCQKLYTLIDKVREHQERPLFCDRIDALPSSYGVDELTSQEIMQHISILPFYSSYIYVMITMNK